ncbi:MAG: hypothetical protein ACREGA_02320 [Candidatus Saccharimonadales bacterium]
MAKKYHHNKGLRGKHRLALATAIIAAAVIIGGGLGAVIWLNQRRPKSQVSQGQTISLPQTKTKISKLNINEPTFTMQLPADWKLSPSPPHDPYHPRIWHGTNKTDNARSLAVYIDNLPSAMPVNAELPLSVHGNQLIYGQLSDNCSSFTPGGTKNVAVAEKLAARKSVWQGVNFICDLPRVIDNQVGTGVPGQPINSIAIRGPKSGPHHYFFLYTDRSIAPDYSPFYLALNSFRAK